MRPFLKWVGGKYRHLQLILKYLPAGSRLVEPFGGSGAVFINTDYHSFLLAEKNLHLVELYQQLQKEGLSFIQDARKLFTEEANTADFFYEKRLEFNTTTCVRTRALLFMYLNRHGYNGLCRYNQKGKYNVPFGRYKRPYFPEKELLHFYEKSQKATFVHQDFRQTFSCIQPGDVVYCDPPYTAISKSAYFASYTPQGFSETDHLDLASLALKAVQQGNAVIISNHDTPLIRKLYKESNAMESVRVKRHISCKTQNGRMSVNELIAVF